MPTWLKYVLSFFAGLLILGPIGAVIAIVVCYLVLNKTIVVNNVKK